MKELIWTEQSKLFKPKHDQNKISKSPIKRLILIEIMKKETTMKIKLFKKEKMITKVKEEEEVAEEVKVNLEEILVNLEEIEVKLEEQDQ